jgi:hypothetical protein
MNYDTWKTTPPADEEPTREACGCIVGTCEGECQAEECRLCGKALEPGDTVCSCGTDTDPAPALEEL